MFVPKLTLEWAWYHMCVIGEWCLPKVRRPSKSYHQYLSHFELHKKTSHVIYYSCFKTNVGEMDGVNLKFKYTKASCLVRCIFFNTVLDQF